MDDSLTYVYQPERKLPVREKRNVVVAGGGITGVMAAVAAARSGADTLLIEARAHLGSVATMGLPIQGYCNSENKQIVAGLAEEFRQRLVKIGGATPDFIPCDMHNPYVVVDPECVKRVCQEMVLEAGVSLLLNAPVTDVIQENGHIRAIIFEGKSGPEAVLADVFIDCTGDADVAVRAGAPCDLPSKEQLQACTLNFVLAGVDTEKIKAAMTQEPERYKLYRLLNKEMLISNPRYILVGLNELAEEASKNNPKGEGLWNIACYITLVKPGMVCVNSVHVEDLCACDTRDLTRIETLGRERMAIAVDFYKKYVPGFEDAYLVSTSAWSGVRETRRLKGRAVLTIDDILGCRHPEDTVALGGYPVDVHDPDTNELVFYKVPTYGISYGCMLSDAVDNLLVAGRTISATREAMASSRVMAQCMALGQAAGTSAAMCAAMHILPGEVPMDKLQENLRKDGAIL